MRWLKVLDHFEFKSKAHKGAGFWSSSDSDLHGKRGRERETLERLVSEAWDSDLVYVWSEFESNKKVGLGGVGLVLSSSIGVDVNIRRSDDNERKVEPFGWLGRDEVNVGVEKERREGRVGDLEPS